MINHNKLVRDKIPEIIIADGKRPVTRILEDGEFLLELTLKLGEEAQEIRENPTVEELADAQTVLDAIRDELGISQSELDEAIAAKTSERGDFSGRVFLEGVEE